jgi:hypothetical protein
MKYVITWQDMSIWLGILLFTKWKIFVENCIIIMTKIGSEHESWTDNNKSEMVVDSFEEKKLTRKWG